MNEDNEMKAIRKRPSKENAPESALPKTNHLLIIAIDDYKNDINPLKNPVRDAMTVKEILLEKYQFEHENIIELLNEEATRTNILDIFNLLINKLTKKDNLIIYFSGHGELIDRNNEDEAYWIPADAVNGRQSTYLDTFEVRRFFNNLNALHVLGIIDCCFSGGLVLKEISHATHRYYSKASRWILTSGVKEPVPDGSGKHSPFAASIIDTLKTNEKEDLSIINLWTLSREGVAANSYQTPLCQPLVNAGHQGGEFYFLTKDVEVLPDRLYKDGPKEGEATKGINKSTTDLKPKEKIEDLSALKAYLSKLLVMNLGKSLDLLFHLIDPNSSHHSVVLIWSGNHYNLQENIKRGIAQDVDRRYAQIRYPISSVIKDLEEDDLVSNAYEIVNQ